MCQTVPAADSEHTPDCEVSRAGYPLSPRKARGAAARERRARGSRGAWLMLALCMAAGLLTLCLLGGRFLPLLSTSPPAASAPEVDFSSLVASSPPRRLLDYTEVGGASRAHSSRLASACALERSLQAEVVRAHLLPLSNCDMIVPAHSLGLLSLKGSLLFLEAAGLKVLFPRKSAHYCETLVAEV